MRMSPSKDLIPALTLVISTNLLISQALITSHLDSTSPCTSLYVLLLAQLFCFYFHHRISVTPYSHEIIMTYKAFSHSQLEIRLDYLQFPQLPSEEVLFSHFVISVLSRL